MMQASEAAVAVAGISSMATRPVLARLAAAYERDTGTRVAITSVGGVDAVRRVRGGEPFDVVVLASDAIEQLATDGHVERGSRVDFARSGIAVAVASGAPRPDIGTEAALRDAILGAARIGYSTGPSGTHLMRLFARWGIVDAIAPRIVQAPPGVPVGALIASGDVELGFQQMSELMHVPGVAIVGALPDAVQAVTVFAAAVLAVTHDRVAAGRFLAYLASQEAAHIKREHGMESA
ncbi:molybdenum ABC transporter substrate-binding protein [Burkholderia ubonensis]|uniref:substrate-binding domain-containing protein n=1 Tax=Burkholderia ubonensis TaxID=101571 RepID=UPI00075A6E34|nr:substrate-binding domain-containing protein [Burkholderia ubonensis]KVQ00829.1 molybdenum ABC transporter substrate-binding protein [Burkholderia ubonensis]KVU61423.1 molybdenum ABC transporter substrate-binding protein [Burkholderia ubonensis]KWC70977.1 molybdenum ABC transporter substrate-binding protein [Burkholderia ubonensis]KWH16706.1 molybdenum ABC transporter substrate-binding protein [Burkholderia ubonensis]OJA84183.1 molybdenum ABC transporter substrate-binding protein [Burkholder